MKFHATITCVVHRGFVRYSRRRRLGIDWFKSLELGLCFSGMRCLPRSIRPASATSHRGLLCYQSLFRIYLLDCSVSLSSWYGACLVCRSPTLNFSACHHAMMGSPVQSARWWLLLLGNASASKIMRLMGLIDTPLVVFDRSVWSFDLRIRVILIDIILYSR